MAQRKKQDDAGGIIIFAIVLFLVVALFLVKLTLTIVFYLFPPALGMAWTATKGYAKEPPVPPSATDADDVQTARRIEGLLARHEQWAAFYQQQYRVGEERGINLTRGSDLNRFDERSNLGRELNRNIDTAVHECRAIDQDVGALRCQVEQRLPQWRPAYVQWLTEQSYITSLRPTSWTYLACTIFLYLLAIPASMTFRSIQTLLLIDPFGRVLISPLMISASIACGAFYWFQASSKAKLLAEFDRSAVAVAWSNLEKKWSAATDAKQYFRVQPYAGQQQGNHQNDQRQRQDQQRQDQQRQQSQNARSDQSAPWHEVLGVDPTASPDTIKAAYREAIKSYHSDKVASLGTKLRELAEAESKRINAAYSEAKQAKGF